MHLAVIIDPEQERIYTTFDASGVELERFADLCAMIPDVSLAGNLKIAGNAELSADPFEIFSLSVEGEVFEADFAVKGVEIRNRADQGHGLRPVRLTLNKDGTDRYLVNLSGFDIVSPIPVQVLDFTADFTKTLSGVGCAGKIRAKVEKSVEHDTAVNLVFRGDYSPEGWTFDAATGDPGLSGPVFETGGLLLESGSPQFKISGKGSGQEGSAEYIVRLPGLHAKADSFKVALPRVSLAGHISALSGNFSLDGMLLFSDGMMSDEKRKIAISGISGEIPLKWPCLEPGDKGKLVVESVQINGMELGAGLVRVCQKGMSIVVEGEQKVGLIPGLELNFSGEAGFLGSDRFEALIDFEIPEYTPAFPVELGDFLPGAAGFSVHGTFEGVGALSCSGSAYNCSLKGALSSGKLLSLEKGMEVEGINVSLAIPDLLALQSAPGQILTFEKARMGKIEIDGGAIDFQIESGGSLFVEKGVFNWCDGRIHTQALRISPLREDYNLILFCDRLNLSMLLEQLGSVQAEGGCTVNGRIPVRWNRGKISFNDGFLFSTPGRGGKIRLFGTEILTAGIPVDSVQFAQLDLAREALKDYDYKWAKLGLSTEDEILVMRLKLDGSPAGPLPFVFREELGGFARVEATAPGSNFQGISLDVNFRLPLDRILSYGKGLSDVMKMMQDVSDQKSLDRR